MPLNFLFTGILGLLLGYIYGLSFVLQEKKVHKLFNNTYLQQSALYLFPILRLTFLASILLYLLHYENINFILFFGCFALSFYVKIINNK